MSLPRAVQPFVDFAAILRAHGFSVSPDQTVGFIEAVGQLGPRDMQDIRRAAVAMLSIPKQREAEFDALFRAQFMGQAIAAPATGADDVEVDAYEPTGGETEVPETDDTSEIGAEAATAERLGRRQFAEDGENQALVRFARLAPARLPRRRSYRLAAARRGDTFNMRKTLREAVRTDGEVFYLSQFKRKTRQRRIVLLIDVSGSMKERNEPATRFAHALVHAADRAEAFTLGTRLTRITPALAPADSRQALLRVGRLVADFDGGTRIGEALQAFLAIPRFAAFARGAAVVMLSDGLERGSPEAMIDAVRRLSRMAWRLEWLTPLAGDLGFRPQTEALSAVLPYLDGLDDGSRTEAVCERVLNLARQA